MREVFAEHRPTVVFHAAAYKHVGLMEANPVEAVRNNAIATRVVAHVAGEMGVGRFVLVSTDKAVDAGDGDGRLQGAGRVRAGGGAPRASPGTRYAAVRFGNVLGSSGSVVPIFRRQIARGGPVTVTDERMTRYFMTIPEAVQLIIRSGSLATDGDRGAEVFVLDMGEPVRIVDLARAMIELSGLDPDRDIAIEIVGRRARREAARGAVQPLRAPAAHAGREDHARRARAARRPRRSRRCSTRSGCSCSRATPPGWPPRWRSCRACVRELSESVSGRGAHAPAPLIDSRDHEPRSGHLRRERHACFSLSNSVTEVGASRRSPPCWVSRSCRCSCSLRRARSSACASGPDARPSAPPKWSSA